MSNNRRTRGEGTVRTLPSGRIEIRFNVTDPLTGRRVRKSVTGTTLAEANARRDEIEGRSSAGRPLVDATMTVSAWHSVWKDGPLAESGRRQATIDSYETLTATHALPMIGDLPLRLVTPQDVRRILADTHNSRTGKPLGQSSLRSLYAGLRCLFADAVDAGLIALDPAASVKRPKSPRPVHRALDVEAIDALLQGTRSDRKHVVVALAVFAGLRRGEILGLLWEDVNLQANVLRVTGSLTRTSKGVRRGDPKSDSGFRQIPIAGPLREVLVEVRREHAERRLAKRGWNADGFVLVTPQGFPMDPRALSRWYAAAADSVGLPDLGLHALRHSAATQWLGTGLLTEVDVAAALGHSDTSLIATLYADAVKDNQTRAIEAAALRLQGVVS